MKNGVNVQVYDNNTSIQILQAVLHMIKYTEGVLKAVGNGQGLTVGLEAHSVLLISEMLDDYSAAVAHRNNIPLSLDVDNTRRKITENIPVNVTGPRGLTMDVVPMDVETVKKINTWLIDYNKVLRTVYPDAAKVVHE